MGPSVPLRAAEAESSVMGVGGELVQGVCVCVWRPAAVLEGTRCWVLLFCIGSSGSVVFTDADVLSGAGAS